MKDNNDMIDVIKQTLDNSRNIQNHKNPPGKFEGESLATNYYYDLSLNGRETAFYIMPNERLLFEIDSKYTWAKLIESNDGFESLEYWEIEPDDFEDDEQTEF